MVNASSTPTSIDQVLDPRVILACFCVSMVTQKTYVVEHLDPECGPWSTLEYVTIARESAEAGAQFCLSSAPHRLDLPASLRDIKGLHVTHQGVEDIYRDRKDRVCLLDPAAKDELNPTDADVFDVFLFGGILGRES